MQLTDATDALSLTRQMIDIPSVSGEEGPLADAVEAALRGAGFGSVDTLEILRDGDAVCARTHLGLPQRVVLAGHLDTVPIAENVPGRLEVRDGVEVVWGRGSVDMLGGCAAALALACEAGALIRGGAREALTADVTWIFYDHEEVASHFNGLGRIQRLYPQWLADGLEFRESLSVVRVEGGIANNVIPEAASMTVNYRFAPSKRADDALEWVRGLFEGTGATIEVDDLCEGARPGADSPVAERFLSVARRVADEAGVQLALSAKVGWTDVARFTQVGVPAMNFGPGDPLLAHTRDEHAPVSDIVRVHETLRAFLLAQ